MIILTRLGGHAMAVNPDLIERAESTPDTVITMVDGHKLVIAESVAEVVDRVRTWRASVAAQAFTISGDCDEPPALHAVRGQDDGHEHAAVPHPRAENDQHRHDQHRHDDQREDDADLAGREATAVGASLARVLRMPQRED